jgi:DNA-binding transcriptional LysR family regulator
VVPVVRSGAGFEYVTEGAVLVAWNVAEGAERRFDRATRIVRITTTGQEIVEQAHVVLADLNALRAYRPQQRQQSRWTMASLSSVSEFLLASALAAQARLPCRFRCIEALRDGVAQAVLSGAATVGIGDLSAVDPQLSIGRCR